MEPENKPPFLAVGRRLVELRPGKTQREFADELGVGLSTLAQYEQGNRLPSAELLITLIARGVDATWLLSGTGSPSTGAQPLSVHEPPAPYNDFTERFALIPVVNVVAKAGNGRVNDEIGVLGYRAFEREWLRREGLDERFLQIGRSEGDSMVPTVGNGYAVMYDTSRKNLSRPGIYMLSTPEPGGTVIKRVEVDMVKGDLRLVSDNKAIHPEPDIVERVDIPLVRVLGQCVWWAPDRAFI